MTAPALSSSPTPARPGLQRRHLLLAGLGSALLAACGGGDDEPGDAPPAPTWRVPAETEPQQAVILASPLLDYKAGWSCLEAQAAMVRELLPHVAVVYVCNDVATEREALAQALRQKGVPQAAIDAGLTAVAAAHADYWVRDYGGIFMTDGTGNQRVVDLDFDGYGYLPFAGPVTRAVYEHDDDLSVRVAEALQRPVLRSPLVTEGGNLHFNGQGTVVVVERSLMAQNPGWTKAQVEAELARVFAVRKVLWLPRSLATDAHAVLQTPYTVAGEAVYNFGVNHADEVVAWVDPQTLLLPEVTEAEAAASDAVGDPLTRITKDVLDEAARILSAATDADGRPLRLVRVPEPGTLVVDLVPGDGMYGVLADLDAHPVHRLQGAERFARGEPVRFALPASYMNFLVTNGLVLVPRFFKPGRDPALQAKDAAFQQVIATHYPGRRVVPVDVDALVVGGGGMHCISQQVPA